MKKVTIIKGNDFQSVRTNIQKERIANPASKIIFSSSENEDLNNQVLEKEKIDIFLINLKGLRDSQKQRNSNFNQVVAKIAKRNNITIGINLDEIIEANKKEKAEIIARLKQNIKLCSKNKLKMSFVALKKENERDIYGLKSLGLVLGMPTWMTKEL